MRSALHGPGCRIPDARLRASRAAMMAIVLACGGGLVATAAQEGTSASISQLWIEPADLERRDLRAGPPSKSGPPSADTPLTFIRSDRTGYSRGYDVRDAEGTEWSIKLGQEAQTEVVASRILWAIGYHQPPTYYVTQWSMQGGPGGHPGPGRFRPTLATHKAVGEWSWRENEFKSTREFRGLIVANLILNNWDWKTSNNRIYEVSDNAGGPSRIFVVRDLGASLGKTSAPALTRWLGTRMAQGSRNDIDHFESQGFIRGVSGDKIDFDYKGIYGDVVALVTPADVIWTSQLMARLSDAQWNDAFTAGGYPPDLAARFIAKLKSKIAEGLALAKASTAE
jgi:hypothetical protein